MSSVDNRIVNMHFNNKDFVAGAEDSAQALEELESTIGNMGSTGGLESIGASVDTIASRFGALQIAGVAALATIASQATQTALSIGRDLLGSLGETIFAAGKQRAIDLEQAKFQFRGLGLDVQKTMASSLEAVKGTAFGLQEAALVAAQFGGAGVKAGDEMTAALRGISGVAAQTGKSYSEIGSIMTGIAGVGRVTSQDLIQFGTRGLNVAAKLGEQMGKTEQEIRTMVSEGQISFREFAALMDEAFGEHATEANETYTGSLANIKAAFTRIGATNAAFSLEALRRIFNALTPVVDAVHSALGPLIRTLGRMRLDVADNIVDFLESLNVDKIMQPIVGGLKNIIGPFLAIFQTLGDAFQTVFKGTNNTKVILTMAEAFRSLTNPLDWVSQQIKNLYPLFVAIFQAFRDVHDVIDPLGRAFQNIFAPAVAVFKALATAWQDVFSSTGPQQANVIHSIADAVEFLAKGFETLTKPLIWVAEQVPKLIPVFTAFFDVIDQFNDINNLGAALDRFAHIASEIGGDIIAGIVEGFDSGEIQAAVVDFANSIIEWIKGALGIASPAAELIPVGVSIIAGIVEGIAQGLVFLWEAMGKITVAILEGFQQLFGNMDSLDWAALFNAILTGGLLLALTRMAKTIKGFLDSISNITAPIGQLTETLKTMQNAVRAQMILSIAIAVALLVASLLVLSQLNQEDLNKGITAVAALLAMMVAAVGAITKINPAEVTGAGGAILMMAGAMVLLAGAVAAFGNMDLDTLAKGLGAVAVSMFIFVKALQGMTMIGPGMPAAAGAILIMAAALVILSGAVKVLGNMDLWELAKGIGAVAIVLGIMVKTLGTLAAGPTLVSAQSIIIMAAAIGILALSLKLLSKLSLGNIAAGLGAIASGLAIMVGALAVLSTLQGLSIVAAQSIIIVAGAILILSTALTVLGELSIGQLAAGLGAIAIALTILLAAAAVAIKVSPGLAALAATFLSFGAAVFLVGAGLLMAATAFTIFATVSAAGLAAISAGLVMLLQLLPVFALQLATAIVVFIEAIAEAAPRLREAFGEIIKGALGALRDSFPEFRKTINELITMLVSIVKNNHKKWGEAFEIIVREGLKRLRNLIPDFVKTGIAIVLGFIHGMEEKADKLIKAGTDLIVTVIEGIGKASEKIMKAARIAITDFIEAMPPQVYKLTKDLSTIGLDIAGAIAQGLYDGLVTKGKELVVQAVEILINAIPEPVRRILGLASPSKLAHYWGEMIVAGLVNGIKDNIKYAVGAAIALVNATIAAGDKAIAKAQKEATKRQIAAEKAAARARIADKLAKDAERAAKQAPKDKGLQNEAKEARKRADARAKAAEDAQKKADAAAQRVSNVQEFREADDQGKGDILSDRAKALSDRALRLLAQANEEAKAAKDLQGKARKDMLKAAREDAAAAKRLAEASKRNQKRAAEFYAQSVKDRIKAIEDARKAEEERLRLEAEFEAATDAGKAEILQKRSEAAQERADKAQAQADALIKQAKKLAKTDAAKAQRLLDRAEALVEEANQAAEDAKNDAEQAAQLLDQANNPDSGGANTSLQLSRSAMEDAASAIDRYTKSLEQAEEAAMAATPVYQFVQNNNSPESLTDLEIYRQTRNLLSAAEIKMGAPI